MVFGLGSANRLDLMQPLIDTLSREDLYQLGLKRAAVKHWSRYDGNNNGSFVGHIARFGAQSADFGCESGRYDDEGGCPPDFGNFSGIGESAFAHYSNSP